jgi:hypothetical protein
MIELQTSIKTSKQDETTRTTKPAYLKLTIMGFGAEAQNINGNFLSPIIW